MINKFLTATALVLVPAAAVAADLPMRGPAPAPIFVQTAPSWGGFYVGANFGVVWTQAVGRYGEISGGVVDYNYFENLNPSTSSFGGLAGVTAGYNIQSGRFVYGVEADVGGVFGPETSQTVGESRAQIAAKTTALATIRARAGIASSNTLFYLTAGAAAVRTKLSVFESDCSSSCKNGASTKWKFAPVAGAGIEHNLGGGWSAKVEGLYVFESGNRSVIGLESGEQSTSGKAYKAKTTNAVVRFGVNYRFGATDAPVLARY